jgi:hypothetical protein
MSARTVSSPTRTLSAAPDPGREALRRQRRRLTALLARLRAASRARQAAQVARVMREGLAAMD